MKVDRIDNKQYALTAALTTAAAGGLAGGFGYHLVPLFEKDAPTDQFVKEVTSQLDDATRLQKSNLATVARKLNELPVEKSFDMINPKTGEILSPKELKKLETADKKAVRTILKNFMIENSETLGIVPKEKQTVAQAVDNVLRAKKTSDVRKNLLEAIEEQMKFTPDNKAGAREYINLTYDIKGKKFRAATEELPQTAIDFVKGAAKKVRLENAKKFGIGAAIAAVVGSTVGYIIANKKAKEV